MADLYGAVTDDAVNRIINYTHARAPYLFNYVAPSIRLLYDANQQFIGTEDLWLTCSNVPDSPLPGTPKYTRVPPFALPGIPVKLPYCIHILDINIDFHPGDVFTLPPELTSTMVAQSWALMVQFQFGLACIPPSASSWIAGLNRTAMVTPRLPVLPVDHLECSVLEVHATGRLEVTVPAGGPPPPPEEIRLRVRGIEIKDLEPKGLENAIECYLVAMLTAYVFPNLVLALEPLVVKSLGLTVTPHLAPGLPNNPAIEQNELRVWLDVDVN